MFQRRLVASGVLIVRCGQHSVRLGGQSPPEEQQQLLLDMIANWVGLADEETTSDALATIEATIDETYIN